MAIYSGIIVSDYLGINSGDTATDTLVSSGGSMEVWGGSVTSTTVNTGGSMDVWYYGRATSTTVNTGGTINGFTVLEDQYYESEIHISNGYVNGSAHLHFGQTAMSTTVNTGGFMEVQGTATDTTVNSGGSMDVGGSALNTTVNTGGMINGFTVLEEQYYASGIHMGISIYSRIN